MADALGIYFGAFSQSTNTGPSFSTFTLNASTDQQEFIFQAPAGGAITVTQLGIKVGTITGTTPTYRISLQGVDISGNPDGTIKGGGSPASVAFSPSGLGWSSNTWHWLALDNSYATTSGEALAVVVDYSSGTIDGSNNAAFTYSVGSTINNGLCFPYAISNDAGARTRRDTGAPCFGFATASKAYGFPAETVPTINATSTLEVGMKFTLPAGWGDTFKIKGLRFVGTPVAAASAVITLYDGGGAADTTPLQTVTFDGDFVAAVNRNYMVEFDEATLSTLTFGNTYRVALLPSTASSYTLRGLDVTAAADWDAWPMGQNVAYSTRNAGNWTDVTTRRLYGWDLMFADITEPAGGGGGMLVHPGMSGRIH